MRYFRMVFSPIFVPSLFFLVAIGIVLDHGLRNGGPKIRKCVCVLPYRVNQNLSVSPINSKNYKFGEWRGEQINFLAAFSTSIVVLLTHFRPCVELTSFAHLVKFT